MKKFQTIIVTSVRNLEEGDLFAWEFLGRVIGAKVTGMRYYAYQLTDAEKAYMAEHKLDLTGDAFEIMGGSTQVLCFFDESPGVLGSEREPKMNHAYLTTDDIVAVFPNTRPGADIINTPTVSSDMCDHLWVAGGLTSDWVCENCGDRKDIS